MPDQIPHALTDMPSLSFTSLNSVTHNIDTLGRAISTDVGLDRRASYVQALNQLQSWCVVDGGQVEFAFAELDSLHPPAGLFAHFLGQDVLRSRNVYPADDQASITSSAAKGLALVANADRGLADVINLLLIIVLFARNSTYGGGSRADMLGTVWLAPPSTWTPPDYAEALWHEAVHQALFLEEMVHGLYSVPVSQMADESALVLSAIRRIPRPYDLAFHAACVASSLAHLNYFLGQTSRCAQLLEGLRCTLPDLCSKASFLSSNGRAILQELVKCTSAQGELLS